MGENMNPTPQKILKAALCLNWPGCKALLIEYNQNQDLINQLRCLRSDLSRDNILTEVNNLQESSCQTFRYWMNECIIRAMMRDPLPCELNHE